MQQFDEKVALGGAVDQKHMLLDALDGGRRPARPSPRPDHSACRRRAPAISFGMVAEKNRFWRFFGSFANDLADRNEEAEVEHVIGLVQHDDVGRREFQRCRWRYGRAGDQASRRARRDRAPASRFAGRCETPPTITPTDMTRELAIGAKAIGDLRGKFARRREHQSACAILGVAAARVGQKAMQGSAARTPPSCRCRSGRCRADRGLAAATVWLAPEWG